MARHSTLLTRKVWYLPEIKLGILSLLGARQLQTPNTIPMGVGILQSLRPCHRSADQLLVAHKVVDV